MAQCHPDPHPESRQLAQPVGDLLSIVQRKALTPNDFSSLADLEQRLLALQIQYERTASPLKMVLHAQRPAGAPRQTQRQTFGSSRLTENTSP
jgi:hypothetical protein